ncbi:DUF6571 family protein [Streptomyces xinghaiensis]|uniref:DUF6571 family protein n=1 Tax=Streptomyces xinghaiensis TaxID=1038928 RepID=UPI0037A71B13
MDFEALHSANFAKLDTTVTEWDTLVNHLKILEEDARKGLRGKANKANWAGYNATVSREFIGKTAGEFDDAHTQAQSIRNIIRDTRNELKTQKTELLEAIARGKGNHLLVRPQGGGFTVQDPDHKAVGGQKAVDALRDELQGILDKATEIDTTAAASLKALVDLTDYGFSGAEYSDRDAAAAAVKNAEQLAALAKKNPEDRSVAEFDALVAGLTKHSGDEIFAEHFASTLGAKGALEFWAGINDPYRGREIGQERLDQFDDLQKHLSLTLATATQADTVEMATWKREMTQLGDQQVGKGGYTVGFQVMSNLMRWGNYEDRFLTDYGTELIKTEKKMSGNGRHMPTGWAHMGMDPYLNRTGTDSGSDPMTGFMKALSNSPDAATDFFNGTFVTKDEDHDFERDTDGNGKNGKVGLTNFQYLFEERDWPPERDIEGEESITGRNNLALALESATTGHPAGEMPTIDTPAHNADQARLVESVFASVSENPKRITDHAYMSDSLGQISAEYMPDISRGLHPGSEGEEKLFPVAGEAAKLGENEITRVLYTVSQNPDGYASISAGQHSYTTSLMEYHFRNPEAYLADPNYSEGENLKKTIEDVARVGGEIQGTIGAGRAYANELEGGAEDKDFNEALETTSTWVGSGVGIGVGIATAPVTGPGGIVAGGVAGTATNEILSALTEGLMKDSSDEVIYRNGEDLSATRDSTYTLIESAAQKAGEAADNPSPHVVSAAATAAEQGFNNAKSNVKDAFDGEGVPRQLDTED